MATERFKIYFNRIEMIIPHVGYDQAKIALSKIAEPRWDGNLECGMTVTVYVRNRTAEQRIIKFCERYNVRYDFGYDRGL